MRLMFLGDVVGRAGRDAVTTRLPALRERLKPDLVVVNGENAAHGFGITEDIYKALREAGMRVDCMATAVAISTYNILQGERRRVAAALLGVP